MLDRDGSRFRNGPLTEHSFVGFSLLATTIELEGFPIYGQPDDYTCGPTCCRMVLGYYGKSAGNVGLAIASSTYWWNSGTKKFGMTHPDKIVDALGEYGLGASRTRGDIDNLIYYVRMRQPPILLVRSGRDKMHYVVVVGCEDDGSRFKLANPSPTKKGNTEWIDRERLAAAWRFDADLDGVTIGGRSCVSCKGDGKTWTSCGTCKGSGKWKIGGLWTKCFTCSGLGRWSGPCILCGGDGRETDYMRKAIETIGITGNTFIYPRKRGGLKDPVPGSAPVLTINYTLWNDSGRAVKFRLPSGRDYELAPGKRGSYTNSGKTSQLKIKVLTSGKTYTLSSGDHKFWWMTSQSRVGLDLNYKYD